MSSALVALLPALLRLFQYTLIAVLGLYVLTLVWLYFRQESLLFFPETLLSEHRFDLPDVTEAHIPVTGATLSALHFRQPRAKGVVFFLHGNGGNLQSWLTDTAFYRRNGFDLFMIDYRGYGKSTGRIESEAQLHADVLAAWRYVEKEYAGRKNILYGRSLGTGLATKLASTLTPQDAALLILVSPYLSLQHIAREQYPWVPGFLMRYPMRADLWLAAVKIPILMLHGERDELIGVSHARRLGEMRPDAALLVLPEAMHNDIHMFPQYIETLEKRLSAL